MFETKKTLIVVYKDELLANQLKKMVETHDDDEKGVVGTRDDSINIVSWTENVWLGNKKAGNISGKILFLGDIKGTDKLIPVIDVKFDECGVKFGWAGNQAVLFADPKALTKREAYDAFLEKLSDLPVPTILKKAKENIVATGTEGGLDTAHEMTEHDVDEIAEGTKDITAGKKRVKLDFFKAAKDAITTGADAIGKVGNQVAVTSEEVFRNKALMKRQMLFFGAINLYNNELENFMNQ